MEKLVGCEWCRRWRGCEFRREWQFFDEELRVMIADKCVNFVKISPRTADERLVRKKNPPAYPLGVFDDDAAFS